MLGVVSEFERSMIVSRINAGIARVKATGKTKTGKPVGRPAVSPRIEKRRSASDCWPVMAC
jgi:DNA invertase Pin-like site-specific DNA recombinase